MHRTQRRNSIGTSAVPKPRSLRTRREQPATHTIVRTYSADPAAQLTALRLLLGLPDDDESQPSAANAATPNLERQARALERFLTATPTTPTTLSERPDHPPADAPACPVGLPEGGAA